MSITAAVAGEAADPRAIPAPHQPIAVMLDRMNPQWAGRWPGHLDGWHGSMKAALMFRRRRKHQRHILELLDGKLVHVSGGFFRRRQSRGSGTVVPR